MTTPLTGGAPWSAAAGGKGAGALGWAAAAAWAEWEALLPWASWAAWPRRRSGREARALGRGKAGLGRREKLFPFILFYLFF